MTEEKNQQTAAEALREKMEGERIPDLALKMLVRTAQRGKFRIPITLTVGGTLIAGQLAGRNDWWDDLVEKWDGGMAGLPGVFAEKFKFPDPRAEDPEAEDDDDNFYDAFIHLTDAQVVTGGGFVPTDEGIHWRGRLSEVQGWSFGKLAPGPS